MTDAAARPAPEITLEATVSGRELKLTAPGQPTLLLLIAQDSAGQVDPVVEKVRESYPHTRDLRVATVIDGRPFPKLVRPVAEAMIKSRYQEEAGKLDDGEEPAEWIYIIPDWEAQTMTELGITDVKQTIAVAALAADGTLFGPHQGDATADRALELANAAVHAS